MLGGGVWGQATHVHGLAVLEAGRPRSRRRQGGFLLGPHSLACL